MTYTEDTIAWPTMVALAACLEQTVIARGLPALCQSTVVPGPQAVLEACAACGSTEGACGGQGWVRFVNEYPSKTFPQQDTDIVTCDSPMAYVLEVGLARCLPQGKSSGLNGYQPPTLEEQVESTRLQMADKAAITAAIRCCLAEGAVDLDYSLGMYQSLPVSGDCGGGFRQVTIWGGF